MRTRAAVLLLLPAAGVLAACGSGSSPSAGGSSAPVSAPVPTASGSPASPTPTSTFPTPSEVSPTGPPARVQIRLVALDNQTTACAGSAWCRSLGYTPALQHAYDTATCHAGDAHPDPDPSAPVVACSDLGERYLLGPAELTSSDIADAKAAYTDMETWAVQVTFVDGGAAFRALTRKLITNDKQYAVVVDGTVVAAPTVFDPATTAELTGSDQGFTQADAEQLAARIKAGAAAG